MSNVIFDLGAQLWQIIELVLKAFSSLLIGLALAYILNGPVERIRIILTRNKSFDTYISDAKGRVAAIILTYLALFVFFSGIVYAFLILILGTLPSGSLYDTLRQVSSYFAEFPYIESWINKHFSAEKLFHLAGSMFSVVINILLGIVASIYLLKDKEFFLCLWDRLLSLTLNQYTHGVLCEILSEINIVISTFIKGALIDSLIVALLSSIVLSILNVRFAVLIGLIGGILNIIPYFGPFFGMVPAFIVAFSTDGLVKALLSIVGLFLVQQLDSNYIYPRVVGNSVGVHPLFVLISISVLGSFAGVWGMLLAVPICGIIQILIKKWANR